MTIILTSPGEIAFKIANFPIYYYGICIAAAVLVGTSISYYVLKKDYEDFDSDTFFDLLFFVILGGFVFARIYYCLVNFSYYSAHVAEIVNFRQGGISIHGGILGGFLVGLIFTKLKHVSTLRLADIMSYGLILAQAIGRWGNFFNSEAYGLPSKFIGVFIPEHLRVSGYESFNYFHPTFLYESLFDLLIFLILFFVLRPLKLKQDGIIFASYLVMYSIVRFFIEGLRLDSLVSAGGLHLPQIVSLVIILIASIFIFYQLKIKRD